VALGKFVPRGVELATALALLAALVAVMVALHAPDMEQINKLSIL
jgi:hypothetical protein